MGYEFIHDIEPVVPRPKRDDLHTPTLYFLIADELLIFDRVQQTITILVNAVVEEAASPAEAYENAVERAALETGLPESAFPADCPFALKQLLSEIPEAT